MIKKGDRVEVTMRDIAGKPIQQYLTAYNTYTSFPRPDEPPVAVSGVVTDYYEIGDKYNVRFDNGKEYGLVTLCSGIFHSTDLKAV
jgi:hypothetical protein